MSAHPEPVGGVPLLHFIDADAIRTTLHARVSYLVTFIDLTGADVEALRGIAPSIRPFIPGIVDMMYRKLWSFDITRKSLVKPVNTKATPPELLEAERERMKYMGSFMTHWVLKIFVADWEDLQTFGYFDRVGICHIGQNAFRHRGERGSLRVDYVHIGLLLGVLTIALTQEILRMEKPTLEEKSAILTALNKVMWIQNDLMSRHYVQPVEVINPLPATPQTKPPHPVASDLFDDPTAPRCPFGRGVEEENDSEDEPFPGDSDEDDDFPGSSSDEAERDGDGRRAETGGAESTTTAESPRTSSVEMAAKNDADGVAEGMKSLNVA